MSDELKIKRDPGLIERYVELMYRRKIRATFAIFRLRKQLSIQDFKFLVEEDRKSSTARSITFFALGFTIAGLIWLITHLKFNI